MWGFVWNSAPCIQSCKVSLFLRRHMKLCSMQGVLWNCQQSWCLYCKTTYPTLAIPAWHEVNDFLFNTLYNIQPKDLDHAVSCHSDLSVTCTKPININALFPQNWNSTQSSFHHIYIPLTSVQHCHSHHHNTIPFHSSNCIISHKTTWYCTYLCSDSSTSGLNIMSKSPFSFTITVLLVPYSFWDANSSSSHPAQTKIKEFRTFKLHLKLQHRSL